MVRVLRHKDPTFLKAREPQAQALLEQPVLKSASRGRRNLAETKDSLGCKAWAGECKAQEDIIQTASSHRSEQQERHLEV